MSYREREQGREAFERGKYLHSNPYRDSYGASYDERRSAREWEDGYREADRQDERRREEEEQARREQAARERHYAAQREEEEREQYEREEYERAQAEAEADQPTEGTTT